MPPRPLLPARGVRTPDGLDAGGKHPGARGVHRRRRTWRAGSSGLKPLLPARWPCCCGDTFWEQQTSAGISRALHLCFQAPVLGSPSSWSFFASCYIISCLGQRVGGK